MIHGVLLYNKNNHTIDIIVKLLITFLVMVFQSNNWLFQGFVHVSTAYSHCPRSEIKEQFYPVSISAKELKDLIKRDEKIQK